MKKLLNPGDYPMTPEEWKRMHCDVKEMVRKVKEAEGGPDDYGHAAFLRERLEMAQMWLERHLSALAVKAPA